MFGHEFDIDGGDDGVHHHAQYGSGDLNDQITGIAAEFIGRGGTGDDHAAEGGSDQSKQKQYPVAFFGKAL